MKITYGFARGLVLCAVVFAFACGGGNPPADTGADADTGDVASTADVFDTGVQYIDGQRVRGNDSSAIDMDTAFGSCFVTVTPESGSPSSTFVINGAGYVPGDTMLSLSIQDLYDGCGVGPFVLSTMVSVQADGSFSYSFTQAGLGLGYYAVSAGNFGDPCTFTTMFNVM